MSLFHFSPSIQQGDIGKYDDDETTASSKYQCAWTSHHHPHCHPPHTITITTPTVTQGCLGEGPLGNLKLGPGREGGSSAMVTTTTWNKVMM